MRCFCVLVVNVRNLTPAASTWFQAEALMVNCFDVVVLSSIVIQQFDPERVKARKFLNLIRWLRRQLQAL